MGSSEELSALDLLLNVAGVMLPTRQVTPEGLEKTLVINYLSAVLLCRELAPLLAAARSPRIANVAGRAAFVLPQALDMDDLQFERAYRGPRVAILTLHAKTVMTEILAEELKPSGIDVNCFHPGPIKGDLGRHMALPLRAAFALVKLFMADTSKSGIYVSTSAELNGVTGQFFVGTQRQRLKFDANYKDRLRQQTDAMLLQSLALSRSRDDVAGRV